MIRLIRKQQKFNTSGNAPVPLRIAYGMAEYDPDDSDPESAEQLADKRMYERKKQMKSGDQSDLT
ncbi:diguanylate cyclase [Ruminococcus sp. HUN007]|uniref:diguanylate cyclase n=1 Tax=Ruminococcus sp. HUN007 TaxID=1514668 RepID=UPI0005D1D60B|nr:diguanylate cyclase [Ruminococcus sp. HUN007]